jgi:outer membrane protein FlgP
MNKISRLLVVSVAGLAAACTTVPTAIFTEAASARAETKQAQAETKQAQAEVKSMEAKMAEMKAAEVKATEAKNAELKAAQAKVAEAKAEAKAAETKNSPDSSSMITPLMERQQTVRATGYAVISTQNHRNPAQQRLMAIRASKLDAYRALTEQVYGQQLDAQTTVAEMMVTSDTFRTRVQGIIYGAVLESISPVGDDTYETTLSLDGRVVNDLRVLYLAQMAARR